MTQNPFTFNLNNLKDGCNYISPNSIDSHNGNSNNNIENTDEIINRKIKNREKLELNELPKSILVEILKHLNDNYSCCINTKPQNPFFHNYCYSDQMTNGRDGSNTLKLKDSSSKVKGKSMKISSSSLQLCDSLLPQQVPNKNINTPTPTSISTLKDYQSTLVVEPNTFVYIQDIINLSLVCKLWAKYIVPISISSFIKISNKKEFQIINQFLSEGIIKGGLPCTISTVKFHNPLKGQNNNNNNNISTLDSCSIESNNALIPTVCRVNNINQTLPEDYNRFFCQSFQTLRSMCFGTGVLTLPIFQIVCNFLKSPHCGVQELKINTNLCGQSYKVFFETLRQNSTITYLDISNNPMNRDSITDLIETVKSNTSINYLDLSFNNIGYDGTLLGEALKANNTIQSLFLIGNQLDNDSVQIISEALKNKNSSITEISLSENDFDDEIGSLIGEIFLNNRSIKSIDLSFNNLSEGTVQGFSDALLCTGSGAYCALETLNLSDCNMSESEEYGIQFFRALQTNQTLKTLILWSCELRTPRILDELASALKSNQTMSEISLGFNNFTSDDISVLVQKGLKYNKSLRIISFNNNYISTVGGIIIAEYLKTNDTVKEMSLFDNCLDNCAAVEFMNTLCVNHHIRKLCMGSNRVCPNLSTIFRKLLQYNRSIPRISNYNNSRQQWITTKLQFLRSELLNLNMKFDQQTQLSNSIRELFKVLNVSCPPSQAQSNLMAMNSLHNAFMNSMSFCTSQNNLKQQTPQQPQPQQPTVNNNNIHNIRSIQQPNVSTISPVVNTGSSNFNNTNNYVWHNQSPNTTNVQPIQQQPQQQQPQQQQTAQQIFGAPLQKPIYNSLPQPLFQIHSNNITCSPTTATTTTAYQPHQQQFNQQHQQPPNIFLPQQFNQQSIPQQQQQQPIQQQPTIGITPNLYSTQQRITRQFEDELIQLQSQLQCDINNNFTPQNTHFNTFF